MRLLITGAGGFVGAAVAREAAAMGHDVIGTVRIDGQHARLDGLAQNVRVVALDLRDRRALVALVHEAHPDAIIHAAWGGVSNKARQDLSQTFDNINTACSLLNAGVEVGISKFVGIGSQSEYGPLSGRISEQDLPEPISLYGAAKLAVLHLTRQLSAQGGISFAWLRLFATYGPGDNPHWLIPGLIEEMLNGVRPRTTLGTQLWDYLFIDDAALGILAVTTEPTATGVFNLGSGQPRKVREIVELIRDLTAPELELVFGEIPYRQDQIWHMEAATERLRTNTGWVPRISLETGLARTIDWHRARRLAAVHQHVVGARHA